MDHSFIENNNNNKISIVLKKRKKNVPGARDDASRAPVSPLPSATAAAATPAPVASPAPAAAVPAAAVSKCRGGGDAGVARGCFLVVNSNIYLIKRKY